MNDILVKISDNDFSNTVNNVCKLLINFLEEEINNTNFELDKEQVIDLLALSTASLHVKYSNTKNSCALCVNTKLPPYGGSFIISRY